MRRRRHKTPPGVIRLHRKVSIMESVSLFPLRSSGHEQSPFNALQQCWIIYYSLKLVEKSVAYVGDTLSHDVVDEVRAFALVRCVQSAINASMRSIGNIFIFDLRMIRRYPLESTGNTMVAMFVLVIVHITLRGWSTV